MSDLEAVMWAVEKDPALRSDFCNLTILDRSPAPARLDATVQRALAALPRLRERVVTAPLRIVPPEFSPDPSLDLAYHVRRMAVPAPGDERALLDAAARLAEAPFDRSRPLWEFTVFDGLTGGRAAFMQKLHHTISDGVGGLRLTLSMLDFERDPDRSNHAAATPGSDEPRPPGRLTPAAVACGALGDAARRNAQMVGGVLGGTGRLLTHPWEIPGRAGTAAHSLGSLRRQGLVTDRARSDLLGARSLRRHFEIHALDMKEARRAAHGLGGTINDLFVTGLAGAFGRYHERQGSTTAELRMAMPVSTRARGDVGANRFAPARVLVPLGPVEDPAAMFADVHRRLAGARVEPALQAAEHLAGLVSAAPTALLVALARNQTATIDFAASSLRGSPAPLFIAGAAILENYAFGPRTRTACNVTLFGYCDTLHLGFNVDPAAVTDIRAFMEDVQDSFAAILAAGSG